MVESNRTNYRAEGRPPWKRRTLNVVMKLRRSCQNQPQKELAICSRVARRLAQLRAQSCACENVSWMNRLDFKGGGRDKMRAAMSQPVWGPGPGAAGISGSTGNAWDSFVATITLMTTKAGEWGGRELQQTERESLLCNWRLSLLVMSRRAAQDQCDRRPRGPLAALRAYINHANTVL